MIPYKLLYFLLSDRGAYRTQGERKGVADALCAVHCNIYRLILSDLSGSPALATLAKEN